MMIRPMTADDVPEAHRIFRHAFGTHLGADDLRTFRADIGMIALRQRAYPDLVWVAEIDGRLAGSVFLNGMGRHGVFGPLTVDPALWDSGIAKALTAHAVAAARARGFAHLGLFTYPNSPKHLELYRRAGFWPRNLVPVFRRPPRPGPPPRLVSQAALADGIARCRTIAGTLLDGFDPGPEIRLVLDNSVGDVVLTETGFAICHIGTGSEAGADKAYVKLAALHPGPKGGERLADLLRAVEAFAAARGALSVDAGCNTGRKTAYRTLIAEGYRIAIQGLAMHLDDRPALVGAQTLVLDDGR
jgi:ribosomal protein S18 acetylase RimI-like enzyme